MGLTAMMESSSRKQRVALTRPKSPLASLGLLVPAAWPCWGRSVDSWTLLRGRLFVIYLGDQRVSRQTLVSADAG